MRGIPSRKPWGRFPNRPIPRTPGREEPFADRSRSAARFGFFIANRVGSLWDFFIDLRWSRL